MAGGYTIMPPQEDKHNYSKGELIAILTVSLAGRVAEQTVLGEITTGAQDDLQRTSKLARKMVCEFGMSEKLGNITLGSHHGPLFLGRDIMEERDYSEETAKIIDEEVRKIVYHAYERAKIIIGQNKDSLTALANALLEKEVLDVEEVRKITGLNTDISKDKTSETAAS
jgi:cell division protease FtsH